MGRFQPATRKMARLRLANIGPSGSGKTWTSLAIASEIAQRLGKGRVAVIDSERGSASLYSDRFTFDACELTSFAPRTYIDAIYDAEQAGYDVVVIDSLSHAWFGKDGALEMVDKIAAKSRSGNSYMAWRDVTPEHNALVDAILQTRMHVITTMRTKTETVLETVNGKQVPRKVGLAPIQREGMEYEFTVVADLDFSGWWTVTKSRISALAEARLARNDLRGIVTPIVEFLSTGTPAAAAPGVARPAPPPPPSGTDGYPGEPPPPTDRPARPAPPVDGPVPPDPEGTEPLTRGEFTWLVERIKAAKTEAEVDAAAREANVYKRARRMAPEQWNTLATVAKVRREQIAKEAA